MQSSQAVPYLKAMKTSEGKKKWIEDMRIIGVVENNPDKATPEEKSYYNFLYAQTIGGIQAPTSGQIESGAVDLMAYKVAGGSLYDALDDASKIGAANAVAKGLKIIAAQAKKDNNPELMLGASDTVINELRTSGKLIPTETLLGMEWPVGVLEYLEKEEILPKDWDKDVDLTKESYTFTSNPQAIQDAIDLANKLAQEAQSGGPTINDAPAGLKAGETVEKDGYLWRLNPNTGNPSFTKKPN